MQAGPAAPNVQIRGSLAVSLHRVRGTLALFALFALLVAAQEGRIARAGNRVVDVAARDQRPRIEQGLRRVDRVVGTLIPFLIVVDVVFISEVAVAERITGDDVDEVVDDVDRGRRGRRRNDAYSRQRAAVNGAVR